MNILRDIQNAMKLTGEIRKARKAGADGVQIEVRPTWTLPAVKLGYWGFTPEGCLFYEEKWKPIRDVFHNFPEETQHTLTFVPKEGEWVERIELWEKPLRDALPPDMYMEAMAILCDWALRCMKRRADIDEEVSIDG